MQMNHYQQSAVETAVFKDKDKYYYTTLGLCNEAGEVAGKVKKVYRDFNGNFSDTRIKNDLAKEIGDVLWYLAVLCSTLGLKLDDVARMNIEKLASRKQRNLIHGNGDNR